MLLPASVNVPAGTLVEDVKVVFGSVNSLMQKRC
jgi:hypothetical protein